MGIISMGRLLFLSGSAKADMGLAGVTVRSMGILQDTVLDRFLMWPPPRLGAAEPLLRVARSTIEGLPEKMTETTRAVSSRLLRREVVVAVEASFSLLDS